jgi:hypothetical protein
MANESFRPTREVLSAQSRSEHSCPAHFCSARTARRTPARRSLSVHGSGERVVQTDARDAVGTVSLGALLSGALLLGADSSAHSCSALSLGAVA